MTHERQMEIQRSLMTMFGDRNAASQASSSRGGSSAVFVPSVPSPKEIKTDHSKEQDLPKYSEGSSSSLDMLNSDPVSAASQSVYSSAIESGGDYERWQCKVCTLINSSLLDRCEACDNPK